ncbi:MAG: hypothetical protein IID18_08385 [Nitrospinae bacterium]|nr:hypothetical protein [Nitrospinota bacterium]
MDLLSQLKVRYEAATDVIYLTGRNFVLRVGSFENIDRDPLVASSGQEARNLMLTRSSGNNSPLIDFYANCDFPYPPSLLKDLPKRSVLIEGLKFLQSVSVDPESAQDFQVIMGEKDVLLDAGKLRSLMPQLQIVEGAGHTPAPLLEHLANTLILRDQKA